MLIPIDKIHHKEIAESEEIDKLAASISEHGLLHAITVVEREGEYYLVAGNKRLAACKKLTFTTIEAQLTSADNDDTVEEIYIHENLIRGNLPWYDQVVLVKRLHDLRQRQFGRARETGGGGAKTGWSLRDTVREVGVSLGTLSQDLNLAEAVLADPSLRKVKDKYTALRLVKGMAKRVEAEASALDPEKRTEIDQVYLGDSLDILKYFPDSTFDAVITDPPWMLYYKDEELTSDENTLPTFKEIYRVMKHDSFLYAVVSTEDFIHYRQELPKFGFRVQRHPLIWVKAGGMTHGNRAWEHMRDYEPILLAVKGSPILAVGTYVSSILNYKVVPSTLLTHPHEKPVELIKFILSCCSYEGSLILDPFAGSGVVAEACRDTKRHYVAIERDKAFYDKIVERMHDK